MIAFINTSWNFYGEIDKIIEGIQENQKKKIESFCAMNRKTTFKNYLFQNSCINMFLKQLTFF